MFDSRDNEFGLELNIYRLNFRRVKMVITGLKPND